MKYFMEELQMSAIFMFLSVQSLFTTTEIIWENLIQKLMMGFSYVTLQCLKLSQEMEETFHMTFNGSDEAIRPGSEAGSFSDDECTTPKKYLIQASQK